MLFFPCLKNRFISEWFKLNKITIDNPMEPSDFQSVWLNQSQL